MIAKRSIQTISQSRPTSSWQLTPGGTATKESNTVRVEKHGKRNPRLARGLADFNLQTIGDGLRARVTVDNGAEWLGVVV